jgi:hypothetical protein
LWIARWPPVAAYWHRRELTVPGQKRVLANDRSTGCEVA